MFMANPQTYAGVLVAVVVIAAVAVAVGVIVVTRQVGSHGSVTVTRHDLQAYTDSACTVALSEIDWGTLTNGATTAATFYIKNTGENSNLTLNFNVTDWDPPGAAQYISLSWNYDGRVLQPGQAVQLQMQLSVAEGVTGVSAFSNRININGAAA